MSGIADLSNRLDKKKILSLVFFLFSFIRTQAQYDENAFEHYTVLDGLSDNNVTCLAQDSMGYIWIGTEMGLNRFDGEEFRHYLKDTRPLHIPGSDIVKLFPCSRNYLGVATRRGVLLINTRDISYETYRFPDTASSSVYANDVFDATQLPDQSIFITSPSGIYSFDGPNHPSFIYNRYTSADIDKKDITYGQNIIALNDTEALIIINDSKLDYFNLRTKKLDSISPTDSKWKSFFPEKIYGTNYQKIDAGEFIMFNRYSDSITFYDAVKNKRVTSRVECLSRQDFNWESKVFFLEPDKFAITCFRGGYYLFNLNKETGVITSDCKKYLPSYKCNCLLMDNENRLWVGTRTGLLKQKLSTPFIKSWFLNKDGKDGLSLKLSGICRYKDKIFLGTFNRFKGLLILDTASMQIEEEITFYGGDNGWSEITGLQQYHKDTLWVGTGDGLLWFDMNNYHYGPVVDRNGDTVLLNSEPFFNPPDRFGKMWLGEFMNGRLGFYDTSLRTFTFFTAETKPALPFSRIKHIAYDSYGDVWIGGHGLARWNNSTNRFDTMMVSYAGINRFNSDILTMAADQIGSLWLYNAENVLLQYKISEKKFYTHTASEGLPEYVQSIANYIDSSIWLTTGNKLISYNPSTGKVYYFGQEDGLPVERASTRTIYYDQGRKCFYSLHNNYLAAFPERPPSESPKKKHLLITEMSFADTTFYNPEGSIRRSYAENNFSIHFTVLDYESPHDYNFYYSVDGKEWVNLDGNQVIFFNSLQPGRHRIQIKAVGKLDEIYMTSINVYIIPPFWQEWWFILIVIVCLASGIYAIYSYRLVQLKKVFEVRAKISKDLHDDIGSTLGSISIYSEVAKSRSAKDENAEEAIYKIGNASRELIDKMSDIVWSINPNNESFEHLQNRMQTFSSMTLTPRNIVYEFVIGNEVQQLQFSTEQRKNIFLIFKEAVHNIAKYSDSKNVIIKLSSDENIFSMLIRDDGIGFDPERISVYNGNGIKNMRTRSRDMNAEIAIASKENGGTSIELKLRI